MSQCWPCLLAEKGDTLYFMVRRTTPVNFDRESKADAGSSRLGLLRRHHVVSLQVLLRHRCHPELAYRSASALDSRSKFTGVDVPSLSMA